MRQKKEEQERRDAEMGMFKATIIAVWLNYPSVLPPLTLLLSLPPSFHLARQASLAEEEASLKLEEQQQRMEELSLREAQRLQQLAEEHERAEELSLQAARRFQEEEEQARREAERKKMEEDEMSLKEIQRMQGKGGATQGDTAPPSYDQLVQDQVHCVCARVCVCVCVLNMCTCVFVCGVAPVHTYA